MSHALTAGISVKILIHIAAGLMRRYVAKPRIVATTYIAAKLPTIRQILPTESTLFLVSTTNSSSSLFHLLVGPMLTSHKLQHKACEPNDRSGSVWVSLGRG